MVLVTAMFFTSQDMLGISWPCKQQTVPGPGSQGGPLSQDI